MSDFREALAQFRDAVRQESERNQIPGLHAILERERSAGGLRLRWAAAAITAVLLVAIPVYQSALQRRRETEQARADELLLQQVNASLSRSVPRAMAPLLGWVAAKSEKQEEDR
jgi:hypothetical protein